MFEVAAAGIAELRQDGGMEPLAPDTVIRVEVRVAPVIHEVPAKALERWATGPSISPKGGVFEATAPEILNRRSSSASPTARTTTPCIRVAAGRSDSGRWSRLLKDSDRTSLTLGRHPRRS